MRRVVLLCALLGAACGADGGGGARVCSVGEVVPDHVDRIGCSRDYDALGYDDSPFENFARTRTVNFVIDRQDGDRIYLLNSARWWLHFDFVYFVLEGHPESERGSAAYRAAHGAFNQDTYFSQTRRYLVGKVVEFLDQDRLVIELAAGDRAQAPLVELAYERVSASLYDGSRLLWHPVSNSQEQMSAEFGCELPIVTSATLFRDQTFQPLNPVAGYGYLRFRKASQLDGEPVAPVDVVVLDRVPNDISVVSGIITADFQTPLSHINILAKNRGTPNMALRGAFDDPGLRALEGTLVKLTVTDKEWAIAPADLAEAQAWWEALRPATALVPEYDLTVDGIVDLHDAGAIPGVIGVRAIGAKAANFAEMMRIGGIRYARVPQPAYALPFAAFDRHLTEHGLWPVLDALLADHATGTMSAEELGARLFELRWAIYQAPMDAATLTALVDLISADVGDKELRFRSSTNVEDLREFSGAGLYTSAGASLASGPAAIENAVKVVWASTFNPAAFIERDFYRVDQTQVRMAVLIHPSFEDELANGVAITINDYSELRPGYYINSQVGEVSVTNPTGEAIPEQILYYTYLEQPEYEVLSRSSLTGGAPVLTDEQVEDLVAQLEAIHLHFRPLFCVDPETGMTIPSCGADVEWKLASDGLIYVKQARPVRGAE